MKGGIVYSDFVTTVSPNHASEALHGDGAFGLGHTLYVHRNKFRGILNGVDYGVWNPEVDAVIPAQYSSDTIEDKRENKHSLRDRFWLRKRRSPIVAYVGRLDGQKGMHLVHHALFLCPRKRRPVRVARRCRPREQHLQPFQASQAPSQ